MSKDAAESQEENNGLVLYHFTTSYYSQRVTMALYEKKLPFSSRFVSPLSMEQNRAWFLKLNPKGQVPVLQDGMKIVPDSGAIIDYLDDNFSNGSLSRLFPRDAELEIKKKVQYFRELIESVPAFPVTFGSLFNAELIENPKYPLNVSLFRHKMKSGIENMPKTLRKISAGKDFPEEFKPVLEQKAKNMEEQLPQLKDKIAYEKVLDDVSKVLDEIEEELGSRENDKSEWWLCYKDFTVADIYLAVLLNRLSSLGFENYFWKNGKRMNIEKYFSRLQLRDSFVKATTIPKLDLLGGKSCPTTLIAVVAAAAVVAGAYYLYKHK